MPIGEPNEYDPYGGRRNVPRWETEGQAKGSQTARQRRLRELEAQYRAPAARGGGGSGGGGKSTCVCMVMATVGGFGYLYADALRHYIDLTEVFL